MFLFTKAPYSLLSCYHKMIGACCRQHSTEMAVLQWCSKDSFELSLSHSEMALKAILWFYHLITGFESLDWSLSYHWYDIFANSIVDYYFIGKAAAPRYFQVSWGAQWLLQSYQDYPIERQQLQQSAHPKSSCTLFTVDGAMWSVSPLGHNLFACWVAKHLRIWEALPLLIFHEH